jgi:hypothetical protein
MTTLENTKAIVDSYLRGNHMAVLDRLADDVQWQHGSVSDVPWYRERRGKAEVAEFFASLADVDFLKWEPKYYFSEGDLALVLINSDYRVKRNGRRVIYDDCVLLFRFNPDGKLARFEHKADLLAGWLAYHDRSID